MVCLFILTHSIISTSLSLSFICWNSFFVIPFNSFTTPSLNSNVNSSSQVAQAIGLSVCLSICLSVWLTAISVCLLSCFSLSVYCLCLCTPCIPLVCWNFFAIHFDSFTAFSLYSNVNLFYQVAQAIGLSVCLSDSCLFLSVYCLIFVSVYTTYYLCTLFLTSIAVQRWLNLLFLDLSFLTDNSLRPVFQLAKISAETGSVVQIFLGSQIFISFFCLLPKW